MEFSGQNTKRVLRNFFRNMTNIISLVIIRNILKPNLESEGRMVLCRFFFFFFVMLKVKYKNKSSAKKTHTPFTQIPSLGEVYPMCFILDAPFTAKSFSFLFKSLFIQLHCVLVVACGIFHIRCSVWEPFVLPGSSAGKKSACNAGDPSSLPGLGRSTGEEIGYTPAFLGFPGGSAGKEPSCNAGDLGLIPGLGRSPGEGKGYPLQCSGLENSTGCISPWGRKELHTPEWLSLLCKLLVAAVGS